MRFIHEWIPTARKLHQTTEGAHPPDCPQCDHDDETVEHFIKCLTNEQNNIQNELYRTIDDHCQRNNIDPTLKRIFLLGLRLNPNDIQLQDFERRYHNLIIEQGKLGWKQLYYGRVTYEWINLQEQYLRTSNDTESNTNWLSGIFVDIWKSLHQRWRLRCETATNNKPDDDDNPETNLDQHIKEEVSRLYALQDLIPPHQQYIFHHSISQLLRKPIPIIKQWITCNKEFIKSLEHNADIPLPHQSQQTPDSQPTPSPPTSPRPPQHNTSHNSNNLLNLHNPCH